MSKKTNALSLRIIKNKNWVSRSFLEDFNYSKVLYQDLYIINFIKNILQYRFSDTIVKDVIIQRKTNKIYVNISYYSKKTNFFADLLFIDKLKKRKNIRLKYFFTYKYFYLAKKRIHPYQKYVRKKLKHVGLGKKRPAPFVFRMRLLGSNDYLSIFSFKRLILLNLILLTRCRVKLHFVNLRKLIFFPIYPIDLKNKLDIVRFIKRRGDIVQILDKKKFLNKSIKELTSGDLKRLSVKDYRFLKNSLKKILHSVKQYNKFLRIPENIERISHLDTLFLTHLVFTSFFFKSPNLLGFYISKLVKRNIKSFNYLFNFLKRVIYTLYSLSDLRGLKIQFKGRLGTRLRKKKSIIYFGALPLHVISSDIKYSFNESFTIYGICGIKIWYYY